MKRIRTKIITVLLLTVLLPVIPLSYLVYTLLNQSYRVGVNPQVSQALEDGFFFSRELYNLRRRQLAFALELATPELLQQHRDSLRVLRTLYRAGLDTTFWQPLYLGYFSGDGSPQWQVSFHSSGSFPVQTHLFQQFEGEQRSLVFSNRAHNLFQAVVQIPGSPAHFLLLAARMDSDFLKKADENLRVYQVYRTLDLSRHFLPRQFLAAFVALTLVFLSLMVLAGAWISARLTAPVSALLTGMEEIGRGNLNFRLPEPTGKDETARLIRHFNRMAAALQENQQRLIYLEKMAMWQQIARKLAHEIKNPLTPIQLTLQQLVDQYDDSNPQYRELLQECSQIINEEIGSLRRLVTEFSRFGRMPALQMQPGDLNQLIQEVSSLYGERIQLELADSLPALLFDRDRLRRVLINLIENAIQADPQNQPIRIRTRRYNGMVEFSVSDKGKGIPPEQLQRIFEPYFSTRKEGMGLGLAITRMIVEEHRGEIQVESRPGGGTTFFIRLPVTTIPSRNGHPANHNS